MISRAALPDGMNASRSSWRGCLRSVSSALLIGALVAPLVFAAEEGSPSKTETGSNYSQIDPYQPRFKRLRPLIAVVGENTGTELIDFLVPYGILSESGVADVLSVATHEGAMQMRPALTIQPQATTALFDQGFPQGADYVIVPAVMPADKTGNPELISWIQSQASKGATIVSICDGALIVATAGLLNGHRATAHWASQSKRERDFPDTQWLTNTRYVADGKVVSSAGVSAAIPLSLALVEAIAGTERAAQVAKNLGVTDSSSRHNSDEFHFDLPTYFIAARNWLLPTQAVGISVAAGVDGIPLALTADAFARTFRSRVYAVASSANGLPTRHGLTLLPDRIVGAPDMPQHLLPEFVAAQPVQALDYALIDITRMYGDRTAKFVATQLEYFRFH
jgi:putative intracellular protease/amidase